MTEQAAADLGQNMWCRVAPQFKRAESRLEFARCCEALASALVEASERKVPAIIASTQRRLLSGSSAWPPEDGAMLKAALLVIADALRQGGSVLVFEGIVEVASPAAGPADRPSEKERIRRQELIKRDEQLLQIPVQDFIKTMEKRRLHDGRLVGIFDLMRDGRELAAAIRAARERPQAEVTTALDGVIDPYLQFVVGEAERCESTGLRLMDIWRYFRHTWVNQYRSVPGRSMMFLVRDRAAKNHPVMGIGAISSPVVQIRERDAWIGWHQSVFVKEIREKATDRIARWMVRTVDSALKEVFVKDFIEDRLVTRALLRSPTLETIKDLVKDGREERERHHRFVQSKDYKQSKITRSAETHWEDRARSHLFRSKRALALAELLQMREVLRRYFGKRPTAAKLSSLLQDPGGIRTALRILRKAKADRVGILMGDISICGAVQPYNALLVGKLVAMLASSPEVVLAYGSRYADAESEIASSMAGRAVVRKPALAFLSTTSLFGGSSQYNRISIPCDRLGGRQGEAIRYVERGRSEAYGTSQFSDATVLALTDLVQQSEGGIRVNSIFGEGQSPKLRKIREGLETLQFPAARMLQHGRGRVVYCIPLIRNLRDFLLGIDKQPEYLVPLKLGVSSHIAGWWKERWFRHRTESPEIITQVEKHTKVYPIRHGARVTLPQPRTGLAIGFDVEE